jgi:hypothetical protein
MNIQQCVANQSCTPCKAMLWIFGGIIAVPILIGIVIGLWRKFQAWMLACKEKQARELRERIQRQETEAVASANVSEPNPFRKRAL